MYAQNNYNDAPVINPQQFKNTVIFVRVVAILFLIIGSIYAYLIMDILKLNSALGWNIPTVFCCLPATMLYVSSFFLMFIYMGETELS